MALAIADVVEQSKSEDAIYDSESLLDALCDAGFNEELAETVRDAVRNCFFTQRFRGHFDRADLKYHLVRNGKWTGAAAEAFLDALTPSVLTPHHAEIRQPVLHQPSPGRVVMCDFRFLRKPEMQKERRAIVVSARTPNNTGRCTVVPVSKLPSNGDPHHFEFTPGTYPFFHPTEPVWATCDHIYTVSLERLWMVNVNRRPMTTATITMQHLTDIRNLMGTVLGV